MKISDILPILITIFIVVLFLPFWTGVLLFDIALAHHKEKEDNHPMNGC